MINTRLDEYEYEGFVIQMLERFDRDDLIQQYYFAKFVKQATSGEVHIFTQDMTREERHSKLRKLAGA